MRTSSNYKICLFLTICVAAFGKVLNAQAVKDDSVYNKVDVEASYYAGTDAFIEFIKKNFQYPERCRDSGISGRVMLRFIVDTNGIITKITAEQETKACPEFTIEAMRVLALTSPWSPAIYSAKKVKSWRKLPITLTAE